MKSLLLPCFLLTLSTGLVSGEEKAGYRIIRHSDNFEGPRIALYAVKIVNSHSYKVMFLQDDYGYVIVNVGTAEKPSPQYILGSRREGIVHHYTKKESFLAAIAAIPAGATLRKYDKCLVPLSYGLTEELDVYTDIPKIAKEQGINLAEDGKTFCNCDSSDIEGIIFEPTKPEPEKTKETGKEETQ